MPALNNGSFTSSRKAPYLPVIRIGDGTLRYRSSQIEDFVMERERLSILRLRKSVLSPGRVRRTRLQPEQSSAVAASLLRV